MDAQMQSAVISPLRICVAANFTIDPIEAFLSFCASQVGFETDIRMTPYNQVFQQLLEGGLLRTNQDGFNLVGLNLDSWCGDDTDTKDAAQLQRTVEDLIVSLRAAGAQGAGGVVLLFPPDAHSKSISTESMINAAIASIMRECNAIAGWDAVDLRDSVRRYSVSTTHDSFTKEMGDIPFTDEMYATAAAVAIRWIRANLSKPRKVIVLDCDNTLWRGVYGEGTMTLTQPHLDLQSFMLRQMESGMLLAIVSKNNESDVMSALESGGCLLRAEHLAAWRINWSPKSENLRALSEELGLALSSFIFVDDSSYECMEVRNRCSEVLVIELPGNSEEIPEFLEHVWEFDRPAATEEDQSRTSLYQAERQRSELSKRSPSLEEFLSSLNIKVEFAQVADNEVSRVAQLTQRTSQFNLTGLVFTEQRLLSVMALGLHECWTVRVKDVFGDYGLVGVLMFDLANGVTRVEEFLLSCRALGRGVEEQMLEHLKGRAIQLGAEQVLIPVVPTLRNQPARDFLHRTCGTPPSSMEPFECVLSTTSNSSPMHRFIAEEHNIFSPPTDQSSNTRRPQMNTLKIVSQLRSGTAIVTALQSMRSERPSTLQGFVPATTEIQKALTRIWCEYLRVEPIGVRDDFFDSGGTSLIATRMLSRVAKELGAKLTLQDLFEAPTIEGLTANTVKYAAIQQGCKVTS